MRPFCVRKYRAWVVVILFSITAGLSAHSSSTNVAQPLAGLKSSNDRWLKFSATAKGLIGLREAQILALYGPTVRVNEEGLDMEHKLVWNMETETDANRRGGTCDRVDLEAVVRNGRVLSVSLVTLTAFH